MAYKSRFRPVNKAKYVGDISDVICRSLWERALAKWADRNSDVVEWGMEYVIIPYYDKGNGKRRRYFTDFYFRFSDGVKMIVEVKPNAQTKAPRKRKKTVKYLKEIQTFATNTSKWDAARAYCHSHGWKFQIWTEHHLRKLGLKIL